LIDTAPHRDRIEPLKAVIRETDGVDDFHAIRARRVGGKLEMDIHILVDADLSVAQGHRIASTVKQRVIQADPAVQEVIVHIEPDGHTPTQLHPPVKGLEPPRCGR
jgi:divalent metal cation (Fe/Co/Zn/Cd) transporter